MKTNRYLFISLLLILIGCGSDDTNGQGIIGSFELETAVETDFFIVAKEIDSLELYYSNSNVFHFDKEGYLVNKFGSPLMVYPVYQDGSSVSVSIAVSEPVKIDYEMGNPKATHRINISLNLPESSSELSSNEFDNLDRLTFNNSTSVTVFDSIGESHILTLYFIHVSGENNTWELRVALDGNAEQPITNQIIDFSPDGLLDINEDDLDGFITLGNGLINIQDILLSNGADNLNIVLDFSSDTTSFNSNFEVASLSSSGFYTDHLKEFKIDSNGLVTLSYVNGEDTLIGRVALAKFPSPYNLNSLGNSIWTETDDSGNATYGEPGIDNFGTITPLIYDY